MVHYLLPAAGIKALCEYNNAIYRDVEQYDERFVHVSMVSVFGKKNIRAGELPDSGLRLIQGKPFIECAK